MLHETFSVYTPEKELSLDEGTCPFKGRVKFRVYNPLKPHRFGIKLYQVCQATSGYCVGFDVYDVEAGCKVYSESVDLSQDCAETTKIVVGLLAFCGLLYKGYQIYMDNYYNSPKLFNELCLMETYACGTVQTNRKLIPKAFKQVKKLNQGDVIYRRINNLLALKFHDKRDVHVLSTFHEATFTVMNRLDRNGDIVDYCKFMVRVDLSDQICQYYAVLRKSVKWWKTLFFHLLNVLLVNVYVLYRKYGSPARRPTHQVFRA